MILNTSDLNLACTTYQKNGLVAIDTEFVWNRTYTPRMGIVQIGSTQSDCNAIDCMRGLDYAPLATLLRDASVTKILHDARQDLGHLAHLTGATPTNVFDTQLAAGYCGLSSGIGLQQLLVEMLQLNLPKTETCTDWCQRPLTPAQLEYALDDVRYLPALREVLTARMDALGTLSFFKEDAKRYDAPELYQLPPPEEAMHRIKVGANNHFTPANFAALQCLAAARETLARSFDLPRSWVAEDGSLIELARTYAPPAHELPSAEALHFRHRLPGGAKLRVASTLVAALAKAQCLDPQDYPRAKIALVPPEGAAAVKPALERLRALAADLHIDAPIIANKATVSAFLAQPDAPENPLAHGWRYELIGQKLLHL